MASSSIGSGSAKAIVAVVALTAGAGCGTALASVLFAARFAPVDFCRSPSSFFKSLNGELKAGFSGFDAGRSSRREGIFRFFAIGD
ncbi:MAG TPA: hypothetical protein VMI09_15805 [Candidatus Binataceae bacterium]|nr:hypothetical protein [Candidatus Binataceae bacterium]